MKVICAVDIHCLSGVNSMNDKFIERIIEEFFETGVLKCSILQIHSIFKYTLNRVRSIKDEQGVDSVDFKVWLNFYRMLVTYQVETQVTLGSGSSNLKVGFRDYLKKVYNLSEGELDSVTRGITHQRYTDFIKQNCCENCLYLNISSICCECPCGEVWDIY